MLKRQLKQVIHERREIMSDEHKETTKESSKPETPVKINIAAPRPSDRKVLNNSLSGDSYIHLSDTEKDDEG